MTQDEFNKEAVELLAMITKELCRSTQSHWWDDMPQLRDRLDALKSALPLMEPGDVEIGPGMSPFDPLNR